MDSFAPSTDIPRLQAGLQIFFKEASAALGSSKHSGNTELGSPEGAEVSPPVVGTASHFCPAPPLLQTVLSLRGKSTNIVVLVTHFPGPAPWNLTVPKPLNVHRDHE